MPKGIVSRTPILVKPPIESIIIIKIKKTIEKVKFFSPMLKLLLRELMTPLSSIIAMAIVYCQSTMSSNPGMINRISPRRIPKNPKIKIPQLLKK